MAFCVLKVHMICEHMKENINQSVYVKRQGQIIQSSNNEQFFREIKKKYKKQKHLNNLLKCLNLMCSLKNLLWKNGNASTITSFLKRLKRLNKILKTHKLVELLPLFIKFLSFFKNFSKFCGNASSK